MRGWHATLLVGLLGALVPQDAYAGCAQIWEEIGEHSGTVWSLGGRRVRRLRLWWLAQLRLLRRGRRCWIRDCELLGVCNHSATKWRRVRRCRRGLLVG